MPTITVKNIPANLHRRLKARAASHGRSVNAEILRCLKEAVGAVPIDRRALLDRAAALRGRVKGRLTDDLLAQIRAEGRP